MAQLIKEIEIINEGKVQYPILINGTGWASTENGGLSVLESGQDQILMHKIIKVIDSAKDFICLQSFLIQDTLIIDALLRAVTERKVKVYVLSSADARLKDSIEEESDFIKSSYIKMLDEKFKNNFIFRTAENFHAKFILIDPKTEAKGFLCTNNFTIKAFTKNPELAIELNKIQCEDLFKLFVYHFWEHATDEQNGTTQFDKLKPANKFKLDRLDDILVTSPNAELNTLNNALIGAINNAEVTLSISTFHLDKESELIKAIIKKVESGVAVTIFCRLSENQFNDQLKKLMDKGVQIYLHPLMHAKSLMVDEKQGFLFTANLMNQGLETGFEVGVQLNEQQAKDLCRIHKKWKESLLRKAIKEESISAISEYEYFKEGKITKRLILEGKNEIKKKVKRVSDLIDFFDHKYELKEARIKKQKLSLIAEIESFPKQTNLDQGGNFEVVKLEDGKGEVIVISESFRITDIEQLNHYRDRAIYFAK